MGKRHESTTRCEWSKRGTLEGDLIEALARVEGDLWITFDCCRKRRIVIDAVLPVLARYVTQQKPKAGRAGGD